MNTIYELAAKGKLRGVKVGKHWRFLEIDIANYLPKNSTENREHPRMKTHITAKLSGVLPESQNLLIEGVIRDISEGGILLITDNPHLSIGHPVRLIFTLPLFLSSPHALGGDPGQKHAGMTGLFDVEGRIVHGKSNGKCSCGIKFRTLSENDQERIRAYVG